MTSRGMVARTTMRTSTIKVILMTAFMMMMTMRRTMMVLIYLNLDEHSKRVGRYEMKSGSKSYTVTGLK